MDWNSSTKSSRLRIALVVIPAELCSLPLFHSVESRHSLWRHYLCNNYTLFVTFGYLWTLFGRMCGTIDPTSCIWWVLGFGIKIGYDISPELPHAKLKPSSMFTSVVSPLRRCSCSGEHPSGTGSSSSAAVGEHQRALVPTCRMSARHRRALLSVPSRSIVDPSHAAWSTCLLHFIDWLCLLRVRSLCQSRSARISKTKLSRSLSFLCGSTRQVTLNILRL
jgi:hypothetical protein